MEFSSKLIGDAVEAFGELPGIGKKSALRLVMHLLKESPETTGAFVHRIAKMRQEIKFCEHCFNVSDQVVCSICQDHRRAANVLCVVENIRDLMAIDNTGQYFGKYHVLGGVISPIDGIGPEELNIEKLVQRCKEGGIDEIIMAISPTIEGDTTIYYLSKQIEAFNIKITTLARGVAFGGELEYADELTLSRAIATRRKVE